MNDLRDLEAALRRVDDLIADATQRAAALERMVGALSGMGIDTRTADHALLTTYGALGVHSRARATLVRIIDGCGTSPWRR